MVTIEKGQGVSLGTGPGNYAEDKILATLKRVKAVDKNISTIFYYNSVLDWPFYSLHAQLEKRLDLAVHDENGELCRMKGDGSFPNHTNMLVFDFAQVVNHLSRCRASLWTCLATCIRVKHGDIYYNTAIILYQ